MTGWWSKYIGAPFVDGGRGPDAFDCWGLVRDVYQNTCGIDLPSYGEISSTDLRNIAKALNVGKDDEQWRMILDPLPLDIVLMRLPSRGWVGHVGVMIDDKRFIHCEANAGVHIAALKDRLVIDRIIGFRRHATMVQV